MYRGNPLPFGSRAAQLSSRPQSVGLLPPSGQGQNFLTRARVRGHFVAAMSSGFAVLRHPSQHNVVADSSQYAGGHRESLRPCSRRWALYRLQRASRKSLRGFSTREAVVSCSRADGHHDLHPGRGGTGRHFSPLAGVQSFDVHALARPRRPSCSPVKREMRSSWGAAVSKLFAFPVSWSGLGVYAPLPGVRKIGSLFLRWSCCRF